MSIIINKHYLYSDYNALQEKCVMVNILLTSTSSLSLIGMVYMCSVIVAYRATMLGIHNRVLLIVASNSLVVNEKYARSIVNCLVSFDVLLNHNRVQRRISLAVYTCTVQ